MGITLDITNHQLCIDACNRCAQSCYECFHACLNESDVQSRKDCISLLVECAMMCQMSVSMMAMNGQYAKEHCAICAKICDSCASDCNMFDEEHCKACAQECEKCADECRKMAAT